MDIPKLVESFDVAEAIEVHRLLQAKLYPEDNLPKLMEKELELLDKSTGGGGRPAFARSYARRTGCSLHAAVDVLNQYHSLTKGENDDQSR